MDPSDIKEEQDSELEVLEAIYADDFRIVDPATSSSGARFEISIQDPPTHLLISFTHSLQYPYGPLTIVVHALEGVSTPQRKKLQQHLEGVAKQYEEMPCVHNVCDAAREWVVEHVQGGEAELDVEGMKFETIDASGEKVEVIQSKAIGTTVTVESFAAWRAAFEQEMSGKKSKEQLEREANKKMTGRQLFESKTVVVSVESESFWEAEASAIMAGGDD